MIGSKLTALAERAAQRYRVLLAGFENVYRQGLAQDPGLPRTQRRVTQDAYHLADAYLTEEALHVEQDLAQMRDEAHATTYGLLSALPSPPDDAVMKHVGLLGSDLDAALRVQLERDVAAILRGLRGVALRAALIGAGRGIPRSDALKIARAESAPSFVFLDRAGRRWPAHKYIRTAWRQALVFAWNETALLTMAAHTQTEAEIQHPEIDHAWSGERITLDDQAALPGWDDVREEVFHPNTDAWLSPVGK